jgi:hypothetical protein
LLAKKTNKRLRHCHSDIFDMSSSVNKQLIMIKNATHETMLDKAKQIMRDKEFLKTI